MASKRAGASDAAGEWRAGTRAKRNPEVVAAGAWPARDLLLSPMVREALTYCVPRTAPFFAYWNRIAVSGTNVAKAIGLNPYEDGSPLLLWERLRGHTDSEWPPPMPPEQAERVARGIALEPRARAYYERVFRCTVTRHDHQFCSELSWVLHGCDGHAIGRQNVRALAGPLHPYIIEIKCPVNGPYRAVPREHMVQMQLGMALHGVAWCDFIMLTQRGLDSDDGGPIATADGTRSVADHLTVWRVHRSAACIELVLTHLAYFVDCLRYNVPPHSAMRVPDAKHALFDAPNVSVLPIYDADVTPLPRTADQDIV